MTVKDVAEKIAFLLSVPTCVSCGERLNFEEKPLCPKCFAEFEEIKTRNCSRCAKTLSSCSCSNEILEGHFVKRAVKVFRYLIRDENNAANRLIFSLKRENRSDVLDFCASELEGALRNSISDPENYIFTNVPRRRAAIMEYGIDHSALLANELAKRTSGTYIPLLSSRARVEQKKLDGIERLKNAKFKIKRNIDLTGKRVIIVDDVITTGASLSAAAALVRSLGAKEIVAASLAIAYKDEYFFTYF